MRRFLYKKVSQSKTQEMLDWCLENNVTWDIWNAEESIFGDDSVIVEFGLEQRDWEKYESSKRLVDNG